MAEHRGKELERNTSYYRKILFQEKRAQESCMAIVLMDRKLKKLRKENDHNKQMLANMEPNFQPFPSGPFTPVTPPIAPRGPEVSGDPFDHQSFQEGGWSSSEGPGSGVTCKSDSAHSSQVLNTYNHGTPV